MDEKNIFIDLSNFEKLNLIGDGSFGKVYKAKNKETGETCAAKITKSKIHGDTADDKETFLLFREVKLMSSLNHPSIIKFIGYSQTNFKNSAHPTILTEYASNGSLRDVIELEKLCRSPKDWNETRKLINIYGIAAGLAYLHANDIIHRDMKPENVLMDDYLFPKISDFGLSKSIKSISESMNNQSTNHFKGTPSYMAPEIIRDEEYSKPVDVYAFAIIVYEIFTGKTPFSNLNYSQIFFKVSQGERPELTDDIPEHYKNLIQICWSENPEQRPTFDDIVNELRTNRHFISDSIDENEYLDYIDYIDNYKKSFNINEQFHFEDLINKKGRTTTIAKVSISKQKIVEEIDQNNDSKEKVVEEEKNPSNDSIPKLQKSISGDKISLSSNKKSSANSSKKRFFFSRKSLNTANQISFPIDEFNELDQSCKDIVNQAENDPKMQYIVGKYLILGEKNFPKNVEIGVKYLEASISGKCIDSMVYYVQLLIKGDIIPSDYDKAKKYIKQGLKTKDSRFYHLNGKLKRKENKMSDAKKSFEHSAKMGNKESMYNLGKMLLKGEGCKKDEKGAKKYFELAKNNGCLKAEKFLNSDIKKAQNKSISANDDDIITNKSKITEIQNKPTSEENHDITINKSKINENQENDCTSITQIVISKSQTILTNTDLQKYSNIAELAIPPTITKIDKKAFDSFTLLTKIIIPPSVTYIDNDSFRNCTSLKEIIIPSSVNYIEPSVFENCTSLTNVSLPSSIKTIYGHAFRNCTSLKQITIPSSVNTIVWAAFVDCTSLTQVLFEVPSSLKCIGDSVFSGCTSLKEINIPPSINEMGKYVFENCSSLEKIIFPSSLNSIKNKTFSGCTSLSNISIPYSIISIKKDAFEDCDSLNEIKVPAYLVPIAENIFEKAIIIPEPPTSTQTEIVIPSSEKIIKEGAFYGFSLLKEITIPNTITKIEKYGFLGCTSLTKIILPSSVKSIGFAAFAMCSSLVNIEIPSSVSIIDDYAFKGCSSLIEISIPSSVKSIGIAAFSKCTSLTKIQINSALKIIKKNLFKDCVSLERIPIPESVKEIQKSAFKGCISLLEITFPSKLEELENDVLMGCKSLKEVVIPSLISCIRPCVFDSCTSLTNISLPSSIDTIYGHAFNKCTSLEQITIPSSVNCIVWAAFANCTSLKEITIPQSVNEIGDNIFFRCSSLKRIKIPNSLSDKVDEIGISDSCEVILY